jgi:signal transduction histidine kinase
VSNSGFNKIERFEKGVDDSGTRLVITDLRDAWSDAALSRAWRSVMLLQPPFKIGKGKAKSDAKAIDPGFSVVINGATDAQQRSRYSIEDTFLKQAIATIEAAIDESGKATVKLTAPKLALSDEQTFSDKFLLTGPLLLKTHYFIYDSKLMSGMSTIAAAEMGRTFGGIRIYRNGFRVLPYGQAFDDWLRLEEDVSRRNLLVPANNRHFFGHIELSAGENPLFEETSSREGLLENEAYEELRKFARDAIEWAVLRIASARQRKQTAGQPRFVSITKKPSEIVDDVKKAITQKLTVWTDGDGKVEREVEKVLAKAVTAIAEYEAKEEQDKTASLEYNEMLRILASLGLSISVFGHEIRGGREAMQAHIISIGDSIAELAEGQQRTNLESKQAGFQGAANRVFDIGGYIDGLMSRTESRELLAISVKGALEEFAKQFGDYMAKQGVTFDVDVADPTLRTTLMHKSEMDSMLLNLLTNSIKSMRKAGVQTRKVRMEARKEGKHIVLGFEDNGGGIGPEHRHRVFDAFFTTTMAADDDGVAGPGTGLGLKIVSDIAQSYGGDARVSDATDGYNCRIEIRVLAADAKL